MSQKYAIDKIKKALDVTRGHAGKTRQMVIAQAMEDPKLLKELVKPHMVGIVAHAVNRVVRGKTEPESVPTPSPEAQNDENSFGLDILKTIAGGDTTQFGQESYGRPMGKKGVSQKHIDAIQAMIKNQGKD